MLCLFQREAAPVGIFVRIDKCAVVWQHSDRSPPEFLAAWCTANGVALRCGMAESLGSVIGRNRHAMSEWACERLTHSALFFSRLSHPTMHSQNAWILLRMSGVARLNYLCRTLPPPVLAKCAEAFDRRVMDCAAALVDGELTQQQAAQCVLPLAMGGAGLRMQLTASPAAYFGAVLAAAPHLHPAPLESKVITSDTIIDSFLRARDQLIGECGPKPPRILSAAPEPVALLSSRHPALSHLNQRVPCTEEAIAKAQRDCTHAVLKQQRDKLVADAGAKPATARRLSHVTAKRASLWLSTQPVHPSLRLSSFAFQNGMRHLLGIQPHTGRVQCHCGAFSDGSGDVEHHQLCKNQFRCGNTMRHNTIKRAVEHIFTEAGLTVESEPALLPPAGLVPVVAGADGKAEPSAASGRLRPDLLISGLGAPVLCDVSVIYVESPSYSNTSDDALFKQRTQQKTGKYRALAASIPSCTVLNFIVSSHGVLGADTVHLLKLVANHVAAVSGVNERTLFLLYARRIAVAVQRGNAQLVAGTLRGYGRVASAAA